MGNWKSKVMLVLVLVAMQSFQAYSYDYHSLSIDCGATNTTFDVQLNRAWTTDNEFIGSGVNKLVSTSASFPQMNTLRIFPSGIKNCYNLPLEKESKYLVRAGFYYGNYDNLRKPPAFGLEVQSGNINVNVSTSLSSDPIYHEFLLITKKSALDVCLIQTQNNQVPFISTLEVSSVDQRVYRLMTSNIALYLESRINYGANQSVPDRFPTYVDIYNRIWKPEEVSTYRNLSLGIGSASWDTAENYPPNVVLDSAIEANSVSESIFLPINFREKSLVSAYFVLYFDITPAYQEGEARRKVAISIDGQLLNITRLLGNGRCVTVSIFPVNVTGGTANLTISPAEGATSPALLNAMEVFSVISSADRVVGTFFGIVLFSWIAYRI
ncbi:Malectin-like carbohydrate-binding domain containing protein [Trema orientale]|uniref:Malectin-like carbohydrate-binding domain containing protein n=1 Tax=Trema orientale TaxID=63057 RepID=A0A2P5EVL8_TREOI|nr:Malectin-like carbohydrate-binding domain containing protein [Trema orientale]